MNVSVCMRWCKFGMDYSATFYFLFIIQVLMDCSWLSIQLEIKTMDKHLLCIYLLETIAQLWAFQLLASNIVQILILMAVHIKSCREIKTAIGTNHQIDCPWVLCLILLSASSKKSSASFMTPSNLTETWWYLSITMVMALVSLCYSTHPIVNNRWR